MVPETLYYRLHQLALLEHKSPSVFVVAGLKRILYNDSMVKMWPSEYFPHPVKTTSSSTATYSTP